MAFKLRNKLASGGKRKGAGRPVEEFARKCRALIDKHKLIEWLASTAAGERVDTYVTELGHVVRVPASIRDRQAAAKMLIERGLGMAPQSIEIGGKDGEPLQVNLIQYAPKEQD